MNKPMKKFDEAAQEQYTTSANSLKYVYFNKPQPPYGMKEDTNREGKFAATMVISDEEAAKINKISLNLVKEFCIANKYKMPDKSLVAYPAKLNEETNKYELKISARAYRILNKVTGEKALRPLIVLDSTMNPIDMSKVLVFTDTVADADLMLSAYKSGLNIGVTARINSVRILELVTSQGGGGSYTPKYQDVKTGYVAKAAAPVSNTKAPEAYSEADLEEDADF